MGSLDCFTRDITAYTQISDDFARLLSYFAHGVASNIEVQGMKTNMMVLVVGPSSISHKTTAAAQALQDTSHSPLGTIAGMEDELEHAQDHVFYSDEFGIVMKGMKSGSYAYKSVIDALNSLYDGKPYTFPKRKGRGATVNCKVSLLATTTPEAFTESCTREVLEGGLFKRMLVLLVGRQPYRSRRNRPDRVEIMQAVEDWTMEFLPWNQHEKFMRERVESGDDFVAGCWQRGEDYIFKLSAIHAACEREDVQIKLEDWKEAVSIVEKSVTCQITLRAMLGYGNLDEAFAKWDQGAKTKL